MWTWIICIGLVALGVVVLIVVQATRQKRYDREQRINDAIRVEEYKLQKQIVEAMDLAKTQSLQDAVTTLKKCDFRIEEGDHWAKGHIHVPWRVWQIMDVDLIGSTILTLLKYSFSLERNRKVDVYRGGVVGRLINDMMRIASHKPAAWPHGEKDERDSRDQRRCRDFFYGVLLDICRKDANLLPIVANHFVVSSNERVGGMFLFPPTQTDQEIQVKIRREDIQRKLDAGEEFSY